MTKAENNVNCCHGAPVENSKHPNHIHEMEVITSNIIKQSTTL